MRVIGIELVFEAMIALLASTSPALAKMACLIASFSVVHPVEAPDLVYPRVAFHLRDELRCRGHVAVYAWSSHFRLSLRFRWGVVGAEFPTLVSSHPARMLRFALYEAHAAE